MIRPLRLPLKAIRRPRDDAEHRLQCALVARLQEHPPARTFWSAIPSGEKRSKATAGRLKAAGLRAGCPDLFFIRDGRAFGLELKALRIGKRGQPLKGAGQSDAQILAEHDWKAAGGEYRVATGMSEAIEVLKGWGCLPIDYQWSRPGRAQLESLALESAR